MAGMKAWIVCDDSKDCSTVVFAETRGKAHSLAMRTDACEDSEWVDVRLRRASSLDKAYTGKWEMDWFDSEDRIALVRDANFVCSYEYDYVDCECDQCPAAEFCARYESMHKDGE